MEEILRCEKKPIKLWDKLPTSTGERRISEPSPVVLLWLTSHVLFRDCGSWVAWPAQALQNVHSIGMLSSLRKLEENKYRK